MERTLLIGAHPDDIETIYGILAMRCGEPYSLVATAGTQGGSHTGDLEFVRRGLRIPLESVPGLLELGIPPENQYYSKDHLEEGEPEPQDGALWASKETVTRQTVKIATLHDITHVVSHGEQGFDGHPDHIDAHDAATQAVKLLRALGRNVVHLAINADHSGALQLQATGAEAAQKLRARWHHRSQTPMFEPDSPEAAALQEPERVGAYVIDRNFWNGSFQRYQQLLSRETYDTLAS